jgi:hypothetical protein
MSGGTLCKDGRGVASVDYPDEKPAGVLGKYKGLFEKKGMKVEDAAKRRSLPTRATCPFW